MIKFIIKSLRWIIRLTEVGCCLTAISIVPSAYGQQLRASNIGFQGALNGANGQLLANGNYTLTFKFYDMPTNGIALGTSGVPNVLVRGGIASTPIPVDPAWFSGQ